MKNLKDYIKIIYVQLSDKLGRISRKLFRNKYEKSRLKNKNFTIFSQNCIGSIMYHDLGERFNSPTINMLFEPNDFVEFLKDPEYWMKKDIKFVKDKKGDGEYPVGILGNKINIKFIHYKTQDEVIKKWEERMQRINWNNIFVIACDGGMSYENILKFDSLSQYKNKIIFTSKKMPEIKSSIFVEDFTDGADVRLLNFANPFGKRYYQKYIDYVKWLNKEQVNEK